MNYLQGLSGQHSSIECSLSGRDEVRPDSKHGSLRYLENMRQSLYHEKSSLLEAGGRQARSQQLFTRMPMQEQSSILSRP